MAEKQDASVQQNTRREPIIRISIPGTYDMLEEDDEEMTLYSDSQSYLEAIDEGSISNIYNELDVYRIYRSLGIMVPDDVRGRNNAQGRKAWKKLVNSSTQTKHEVGHAALPWIIEIKDKTDSLYTELSNLINRILHSPYPAMKDKCPSQKAGAQFSSTPMKQGVSEEQNKNMAFWFHDKGAWKSLVHPEIQIPCSVATQDACANEQNEPKEFEEKLQNVLKIVVEMKNLIPVISDKMGSHLDISDDSLMRRLNVSLATKMDRAVQTDNVCFDAVPLTPLPKELSETLNDPGTTILPTRYSFKNSTVKSTQTESSLTNSPACQSGSSTDINVKSTVESDMSVGKLLTPICELLGTGDVAENEKVSVDAGESLYTFFEKSDNFSTGYTSGITVSKEALVSRQNETKNRRSSALNSRNIESRRNIKGCSSNTVSVGITKKPQTQTTTKGITFELGESSKGLPKHIVVRGTSVQKISHSISDKSNLAEGVHQKSAAKNKTSKSNDQHIAAYTFGKGTPTHNFKTSASRKNAQGLGNVTRNISKVKLLNRAQSTSVELPANPKVDKVPRPESLTRSKTCISVTNFPVTPKSVAGPSKERFSRKEDPLPSTGAIAKNPKPSSSKRPEKLRTFVR